MLSSFTGKTEEEVAADCERELYLSAEEAKAYGLLERVIV
ncbi:ATP-dependent Clp protease proteolytic subunit [Robinsoniella peoriensis]